LDGLNLPKREHQRRTLDVYERIPVELMPHGLKGLVVDLSPQGVGVQVQGGGRFQVGQEVTLVSKAGVSQGKIVACKVNRLGVVWDHQPFPKQDLLVCPSFLAPSFTADNPFLWDEPLFFQPEFFTGEGVGVITSLRSKVLWPGLIFPLSLVFPGQEVFKVLVKIAPFFKSEGNRCHLFLAYAQPVRGVKVAIADHLLMVSSLTVQDFHKRDWPVAPLRLSLSFSFGHPPTLPRHPWVQPSFPEKEGACLIASIKATPMVACQLLQRDHLMHLSYWSVAPDLFGDTFVPMLRRILKIATTQGVSTLVLKASKELQETLSQVGFMWDPSGSRLDIKAVLEKRVKLEPHIWQKLYSTL
jgi:hypothetical protein